MFIFTRFEDLRNELGITKKFIATSINRAPTVCQDWKYGKSEPNDNQIQIIADILHTTPAYLRGETDQKEKDPTPERDEVLKAIYEIAKDMTPSELALWIEKAKQIKEL